MGFFNGISHAIMFFNTKAGFEKTGIVAMMKLCFGSDDDAISQILYSTPVGNKTPIWMLPFRTTRMGTVTIDTFSIFPGKVGEEILGAVGRAADRLKKAGIEGKLYGRSFRITKAKVDEIKAETTLAK